MGIKEQIERLKREIKTSQSTLHKDDSSQAIDRLRVLLREETKSKRKIKGINELADHLGAQVCKNPYGEFVIREEIKESSFFGEDVERIYVLAKEDIFRNFDLSRNVFLDVILTRMLLGLNNSSYLIFHLRKHSL
jgi:hypothetical protein